MGINLKNAVSVIVSDPFNADRITETLHYIIKGITSQLGYLELSPTIANQELPHALVDSISKYYATLSHSRMYKDVDSLVIGCLERPNFANSDFISSLNAIKRSAVAFFNSYAKDAKKAKTTNAAIKTTAKRGGEGPQVVSENHDVIMDPASVGLKKVILKETAPVVAPRNIGIVEQPASLNPGIKTDTVKSEQLRQELTGTTTSFVPVNTSVFLANANSLKDSIKKEALDGDNEPFDNGKGIRISAEDMAKYTDVTTGEVEVGELLSDEYPLLTWYIMQSSFDSYSEDGSNSGQKGSDESAQSSSTISKIMTVPKNVYDSIMSNFK